MFCKQTFPWWLRSTSKENSCSGFPILAGIGENSAITWFIVNEPVASPRRGPVKLLANNLNHMQFSLLTGLICFYEWRLHDASSIDFKERAVKPIKVNQTGMISSNINSQVFGSSTQSSKWTATAGNVALDVCAQRRFRSDCAFAQSDQNLLWALFDSQGCTVSSCGHRRFWSEWADGQADLNLRWAHMSEVRFLSFWLIWFLIHD